MRKIEKQLHVFLKRGGVDPSRLPEAVSVFEKRFKDYFGLEYIAINDQGEYLELDGERMTPEKYIEGIKSGELGSPEEKKYFTNHFVNEAIRSSRGSSDIEDIGKLLREAAGFNDESG